VREVERVVRYYGEELAAVAGITKQTCLDALRLIEVKAIPLPFVVKEEDAKAETSPRVFEKNPTFLRLTRIKMELWIGLLLNRRSWLRATSQHRFKTTFSKWLQSDNRPRFDPTNPFATFPMNPHHCKHLRTKKMFVPVQENEVLTEKEDSTLDARYWCNRTMTEIGIDDEQAHPRACNSSRCCFEE